MANYAVNDFTETASDLAGVLALLETKLETIDDSKAIKLCSVHQVGNQWAYALVTIA
tara:strand:+ start:133 stop:303 length:171 start_codon:yes stop_codon:yes gene_type:complete